MRRVEKRPGLYEVAPGRYKLVVYAGLDDRGRQHQRTRTFTAPHDRAAIKQANAVATALDDTIRDARDHDSTVAGLVDRWEKILGRHHSPSTVRGRRAMLARVRHDLGRIRLDELTARHVDDWMAAMRAAGLSSTTVANHWSCLRALLRQGKRWKMVVGLDAIEDSSPPRRVSNRRGTPPTASAFGVMYDAATPDLRVAVALAAWAGLRRGEIIGLRWSDIDGDLLRVRRAIVDIGDGHFHVKPPKSGEARDVSIDPGLAAILGEHRSHLEQRAAALGGQLDADGPVLANLTATRGDRLAPGALRGQVPHRVGWLTLSWKRHAARMGASGVRLHDLRHHYATELIDAGIPLPVVQRQLGHLQLSTTTNVYAHAVDSGARRAADAIKLRRVVGDSDG